jgi:hypothetical protein
MLPVLVELFRLLVEVLLPLPLVEVVFSTTPQDRQSILLPASRLLLWRLSNLYRGSFALDSLILEH